MRPWLPHLCLLPQPPPRININSWYQTHQGVSGSGNEGLEGMGSQERSGKGGWRGSQVSNTPPPQASLLTTPTPCSSISTTQAKSTLLQNDPPHDSLAETEPQWLGFYFLTPHPPLLACNSILASQASNLACTVQSTQSRLKYDAPHTSFTYKKLRFNLGQDPLPLVCTQSPLTQA